MYVVSLCISDHMICSLVLLNKEIDVLELMIDHGVMESLCEIFSTCEDEDTLVWELWLLFLC